MKITSFWINNTIEDIEVSGMTEEYASEEEFFRVLAPMVRTDDLCGFLDYSVETILLEDNPMKGRYKVISKRSITPNFSNSNTPTIVPFKGSFIGVLDDFFLVPVSKSGKFLHLDGDLEEMSQEIADVLIASENLASAPSLSVFCPQLRPFRATGPQKEKLVSKDVFFFTKDFEYDRDKFVDLLSESLNAIDSSSETSNILYCRLNQGQLKKFYRLPLYTSYLDNQEKNDVLLETLKNDRKILFKHTDFLFKHLLSFFHIGALKDLDNPIRFFYLSQPMLEMMDSAEKVIPWCVNIKDYKKKICQMKDSFSHIMSASLMYNYLYDELKFLDKKIEFFSKTK